jgi:hypothetical protein
VSYCRSAGVISGAGFFEYFKFWLGTVEGATLRNEVLQPSDSR